jgi:cytochrome c oxidase cbb3-type subunit III
MTLLSLLRWKKWDCAEKGECAVPNLAAFKSMQAMKRVDRFSHAVDNNGSKENGFSGRSFLSSGESFLKTILGRQLANKFVVCAMILCSGGGAVLAQTTPRSARTARPSGGQLAETGKTFAATCAGCHGLDGRGGERGPDIASREEIRRRSDAQLLQTLRNGISETGMPNFAALGDTKLKALVSYLRTLQGSNAPVPIPGNPQQGESLFFGSARCAECHTVNGRGGFIGSDLSVYAGDSSPVDIRHAIVSPDRDSRKSRGQVQVTLLDGRVWEGMVRNEDNFSLQLQSLDGAFRLIQRQEVSKVETSPQPLMPADYGKTLSPAELDDIVGYLMSVARKAAVKAPKSQRRDQD